MEFPKINISDTKKYGLTLCPNLYKYELKYVSIILGNANAAEGDAGNPKFWKTEKRVRFFIRRICKTSAWFWFVICMVFLNTCTIAVQHYGQPQWLEEFLCKFPTIMRYKGFGLKIGYILNSSKHFFL